MSGPPVPRIPGLTCSAQPPASSYEATSETAVESRQDHSLPPDSRPGHSSAAPAAAPSDQPLLPPHAAVQLPHESVQVAPRAAAPTAPPVQTTPRAADTASQDQQTRFLLDLEFTTLLASPAYLNFLAAQKLLADSRMVAYLAYLRYWTRAEYVAYLHYPGPTLRHLELLQHEPFRKAVLSPDVVALLSAPDAAA